VNVSIFSFLLNQFGSWIRISNTRENNAKKQNYILNPIFILLRVQTTRVKSLQVLVSGTMEMQGVFSLAEFVTGGAVVTSGHQMVNLEPM
jgi:hypothetical protein